MRKRRAEKRDVLPDAIYNSKVVTKLINTIMLDGKKGTAEKILYEAFDSIREKTGKDPIEVFQSALENIQPVGGANVQVPIEVSDERGLTLALRWLVQYARNGRGRTMAEKLANEIMDAAAGTGGAAKKREDTHRMAEANKAFAHYRW